MILQSHDLVKSFGGVTAVDHLSLEVEKGSVFGIIGPNGSGKTTFFNLINGVYPPTSGTITFNGRNITGLRPHQIAKLGIGRTYQVPAPFTKMTVLENVMVSTFMRTSSLKESRKVSWEILERVRLEDKGNSLV